MEPQTTTRDAFERIAEEFAARYRRGEHPAIAEYCERYPLHAAEIRELFPALMMMERIAPAVSVSNAEAEAAGRGATVATSFGDYRIIREIGRGGMGVVYEAEQISLGRHVAVKVLPSALLADRRQRERFEREARAAARLHHTNIVPVFAIGRQEGLLYYVMQFIQGLALDEVLDELREMRRGSNSSGSLGSAGELRVSPRQALTADVARSLCGGSRLDETARLSAVRELTGDATELSPSFAVGQVFQPAAGGSPDDGRKTNGPTPDADHNGDGRGTGKLENLPHDRGPSLAATVCCSTSGAATTSATQIGRLSDKFSLSAANGTPGEHRGPNSSSCRQTYWQSVARIGVQVAGALQYAHEQGILHRDIKPANLLLDLRGTVWVTDFGLAKAAEAENLTRPQDLLGTLRYMPPEAFEGKSGPRSDVYALGLTLYEMLALAPAFCADDKPALVKLVTTGEPPRLDKIDGQIPGDLVTVVHKTIERDATQRYQTAGDLAADLQRFLDDRPILARRVSSVCGAGRAATGPSPRSPDSRPPSSS